MEWLRTRRLRARIFHRIIQFASPTMKRNVALTEAPVQLVGSILRGIENIVICCSTHR